MAGNNKTSSLSATLGEFGEFFSELLKIVLISLAIILPIRHFVVKPFYVKGASMQPTFENHDYLLIDEFSYYFNEPKRGDVVVFQYPRNLSEFFIKRIVGLPGDEVSIKNGHVTVTRNGDIVLDEEMYLPDKLRTSGSHDVKVPDDHYFLLGDNRSASLDSRVFGPVDTDFIEGRVWIRAWPFNNFSIYGFDDIPGLE